MNSEKLMNSKLYRIFDYVFRLILLNFLIFLISLSFLFILPLLIDETIALYFSLVQLLCFFFPSIVAVFQVIKEYEENKSTEILRPFFKSFKKQYFKSLLFSFVIVLSGFALYNSLYYFYSQYKMGIISVIGFYLSISFILIALFCLVNLPLVMVYFTDLRKKDYLKLSLLMAFDNILNTFLMIAIIIISIIISFVFPYYLAFVGISLPIYLLVKLTFKQYSLRSAKFEREKQEEEI